AQLEHARDSGEREYELLKSEEVTLQRQITEAQNRLGELAQHREALQQEIEAHRCDIEEVQVQREAAQQLEEQASTEVSELRIKRATHEQKHETLLAQRAPMLARQRELAELISTRTTDIARYDQRLLTQAAGTEAARAA